METKDWIMVVDDDHGIRKVLRQFLEMGGFACTSHSRCATAMAELLDGPPHPQALVLDLHLPDVSGLELVRGLHGMGLRIPTMVISGLFDSLSPEQMSSIGCQAYLEKPFTHQQFLRAVREILDGRNQHIAAKPIMLPFPASVEE